MYLPGPVESGYDEVAIVEGMMIGIEDMKASKISVYPNPTTGLLNINHSGITKIRIYNPIGAQVCEPKLQTPIDLSTLAKGMYIIEIEADDGRWSKKILLE